MFYMLFITFRRSHPRRVWTPEKVIKSLNLQKAYQGRAERIQEGFEATADGIKLIDEMTRSKEKIEQTGAKKLPKEELKLAYLENAFSYLLFLRGLRDYAKTKKASQQFIKEINRNIGLAEKNLANAGWIEP
jgi:hypothetical protein